MKKVVVLFVLILFCSFNVFASDVSDIFSQKYNNLKPPANSSVHSDYLFEQIALGSEYTIIMLNNLIGQNNGLNGKAEIIIEKFDVLIEQNKKIIELLSKQYSE